MYLFLRFLFVRHDLAQEIVGDGATEAVFQIPDVDDLPKRKTEM